MNSPLSRAVVVVALVVAACGGTGGTTTPGSTPGGDSAPSGAAGIEAPPAIPLSYSLQAGDTFTYEVILVQDLAMTSAGDPSVMDGEEPPGEADLHMEASTTFTYSVADGPEPGTYAVTISGDFTDLTVSGTVDGEPVDPDQLPDLADLDPVETTIVVDEKGPLVPDANQEGDPFAGLDFFGPGSLPGSQIESFFGPPLPDTEVTVGDTWTETTEIPMPFGEESVVTTVEGRVIGTDEVDGVEVFVVEANTSTTQIRFDLGEFFAGFFGAFLPEDATEAEKAEVEALAEGMKFLFTIDPTLSSSKSWLDPDTGILHRAEIGSSVHFTLEVAMPDEDTEELIEFDMDLTLGQDLTFRYLGSTGA